MRFDFRMLALSLTLLGLLPLQTSACEGSCITNVTNKFIDKYAIPKSTLLDKTNQQLNTAFQVDPATDCSSHLQAAYSKVAYDALELAIFPSYFHGKCQRLSQNGNGSMVDPPGCPNPDCPVVCGTPGSMVHFYSVLTNITYETHRAIFKNTTEPDSEGFQNVQSCLSDAIAQSCGNVSNTSSSSISSRSSKPSKFSRLFAARFSPSALSDRLSSRSPNHSCYTQSKSHQEKTLSQILRYNMVDMWQDVCDQQHDLQLCSWKKEMTEFILSFP